MTTKACQAEAAANPVHETPRSTEPCLNCCAPVPIRRMGGKDGHCPNCRHPYPHGDCSD